MLILAFISLLNFSNAGHIYPELNLSNNQENQAVNYITFKSSENTYDIVHMPSNTYMGRVTPEKPLTLNKNISPNTTYSFQVVLIKKNGKKKRLMLMPVPVMYLGTVAEIDGKKVTYTHFK